MSTSPKRKALGKGLSALLPEPTVPPPAASPAEVAVERLEPNPQQPRAGLDPVRLSELAASILYEFGIENFPQ